MRLCSKKQSQLIVWWFGRVARHRNCHKKQLETGPENPSAVLTIRDQQPE